MKTDTMKIVALFQAAAKNGVLRGAADVSLKRLKAADDDLDRRDMNEGYRSALKDRIKTLEERNGKATK